MAKTLKDYFGFKSTTSQPSIEEVEPKICAIPDVELEVVEDILIEPKLEVQKNSKKSQVILNKRKRNTIFSSNSSEGEAEKSPLKSKPNKVRKTTSQSDIETDSLQELCSSSKTELKLEAAKKKNEQSSSISNSSQEYSPPRQINQKPNSILKYFSSCCDQLLKEEQEDSDFDPNSIVCNPEEHISDSNLKNFDSNSQPVHNNLNSCEQLIVKFPYKEKVTPMACADSKIEYISTSSRVKVKKESKQKHVNHNKVNRSDVLCPNSSESKQGKSYTKVRIERGRKKKGEMENRNDSMEGFNPSSQVQPKKNKSRKKKENSITKNDILQEPSSSHLLEPKPKKSRKKKEELDNKNDVVHELSSSPDLELKSNKSKKDKPEPGNKNDLYQEPSSSPKLDLKLKKSRKKKEESDIKNDLFEEPCSSPQSELKPKKFKKKKEKSNNKRSTVQELSSSPQLELKPKQFRKNKGVPDQNNLLQESVFSPQLEPEPEKTRNRKSLSDSKNDSPQEFALSSQLDTKPIDILKYFNSNCDKPLDEVKIEMNKDNSFKMDDCEQDESPTKTKSKRYRKNKDQSNTKSHLSQEFRAISQVDPKPNSILKYFSSNRDKPLKLGQEESYVDLNSTLCISEENAGDTICILDNVTPNEQCLPDNVEGCAILVLKETPEEGGKKKPRWSMRLKLGERKNNQEGSPIEDHELSTEEFEKDESKSLEEVFEDTTEMAKNCEELVEQSRKSLYEEVAERSQKHEELAGQSETEGLQTRSSMDESNSGRNDCSKASDDENVRSSPVLRRSCRVRKPVTKFLIKSDSDDESDAPKNKKNRRTRKKENSSPISIDSCSSSEGEMKKKVSRKLAPIFVRPKKVAPTAEELAKEAAKMAFLSSGVPDEIKAHQDLIERLENIEYQYVPRISHVQQLDSIDLSWIKPSSSMPLSQKSLIGNIPKVGPIPCFDEQLRVCVKPRTLRKMAVYKPKSINWVVIRKFVSEFRSHVDIPFYQLLYRLSKNRASEDLPWSEKYQPRKIRDIILSRKPVEKLYKWGKDWKSAAKRRRRLSSDSDDCEEIGHGAVLISGGCSSGKTTGVYAVAESLEWYFVEINTSIKRSGRSLQLALQEAMQANQMAQSDEKTCAVLIEDVDIVFEEDKDGYYQTLQTLIKSSRCPIVMTASSKKVDPILDNLKINVDLIEFESMNEFEIAAYTSCVCLIEGTYMSYNTALELVNFYKKDLRSVLAYVQFWLQDQKLITIEDNCLSKLSLKAKNERNSVTNDDSDEEATELDEDEFIILKNGECEERNLFYCDTFEIPRLSEIGSDASNRNKKVELRGLSKLAEYLENESSLCLPFIDEQECIVPIWKEFSVGGIGDSYMPFRDTEERFEENKLLKNIVDLAREKNLLLSKKSDFSKCAPASFNRVSEESFRTWVDMHQSADKMIANQLELTNYLSRNTVALDYLPCVRGIYQAETAKIDSNSRRSKRLYHYAKSLDLDIPVEMIQSLLTVFQ